MNVLRDLLATLVMAIIGPIGMFADVIIRGMESEDIIDNLLACVMTFAIIMICCLLVTMVIYKIGLLALGMV